MIEKVIIIALFTIGYCCTFWPGMIFERVGNYLELQLPEWLWKPIGGCYICTCFWLGSAVYWVTWHNSLHEWFICVIGAMGLNAVVSEFTNKPVEVKPSEEDGFEASITMPEKSDGPLPETTEQVCQYCSWINSVSLQRFNEQGGFTCLHCEEFNKRGVEYNYPPKMPKGGSM